MLNFTSIVFLNSSVTSTVLPSPAGGDFAFIGARGISLSGGQRARVALARAAYNPKAVAWKVQSGSGRSLFSHGTAKVITPPS